MPISTISISLVGIGIEIDHVAGFFGGLRAGVHGHGHVGLGQRGRIVRAVAGHGHQPAAGLILADHLQLGFGRGLGEEIIDARLGGDGGGGQRVVAGDHHGLDAHPAQFGEAFLDAALDDVLEIDDAQRAIAFGHDQRRAAALGDLFDRLPHFARTRCRRARARMLSMASAAPLRICRPSKFDAAHPRLRGEGNERRAQFVHVAAAQAVLLLGQHDDAAAFRRFVGQRRQLRGVGQIVLTPRRRPAMNSTAWRLPSVIVPVLSSSSTSTSPAASTARPDMAITLAWIMRSMPAMPMAESRPPIVVGIRQTSSATSTVTVIGVPCPAASTLYLRKRQQRDADEQEDDRHRGQQNVERDFVGRLLPLGAFDQRNHAVQKRFAGIGGDAHHEPIGEHARAAGDAAAVAAAFADDRGAFAGDGAFVDRGDAFDHFAVAGNQIAGFDEHHVVLAQARRRRRADVWRRSAARRASWPCTSRRVGRSASAWALPRPSAIASAKLANSTVNHSQAETPKMNPGDSVPPPASAWMPKPVVRMLPTNTVNITGLRTCRRGFELQKRIDNRPPHNRRIEQRSCFRASSHDH